MGCPTPPDVKICESVQLELWWDKPIMISYIGISELPEIPKRNSGIF